MKPKLKAKIALRISRLERNLVNKEEELSKEKEGNKVFRKTFDNCLATSENESLIKSEQKIKTEIDEVVEKISLLEKYLDGKIDISLRRRKDLIETLNGYIKETIELKKLISFTKEELDGIEKIKELLK